MFCCGLVRLSSICDLTGGVQQWSVPINPAVATDPRFTVSAREWLLPMAVRFWPVVAPRVARFCPPEHNESGWIEAHAQSWAKWELKQGVILALLPFYLGHSLEDSFRLTVDLFPQPCTTQPWNTQSIPAAVWFGLRKNLSRSARK